MSTLNLQVFSYVILELTAYKVSNMPNAQIY